MSAQGGAASDVVLRPAVPTDHDGILALAGLGASTRSLLHLDLAGAKPRHVVVAVVDGDAADAGTVVGVGITTRQPDEVHVLDLAVATSRRRTGIARRLLAWLAAAARADGATAMTLEVRVSNDGARALYAAAGFTDHGIRPGYYQDGEDAAIMWHHDLASLAASATPSAATRTA